MWNIRSEMRDTEYYDEKYRNMDSVIADASRAIKKFVCVWMSGNETLKKFPQKTGTFL